MKDFRFPHYFSLMSEWKGSQIIVVVVQLGSFPRGAFLDEEKVFGSFWQLWAFPSWWIDCMEEGMLELEKILHMSSEHAIFVQFQEAWE